MHGTWKTIRPAPTLEELEKHWDKFGSDKVKDGFGKWNGINYKTWAQASGDSLIEVAVYFLKPDEVFDLLDYMELPDTLVEQARKELLHADGNDNDIRNKGRHSQRGGVSGIDGAEPLGVPKESDERRNPRSRRPRAR